MKSVSLPPYAPTLIESTRAIGYSLEAAIADIIDNSISANSSSIDVFFFPVGDSYIAILDNGNGMSGSELETAMRYGSYSPSTKREPSDLGRFGLGLKTASLSQCRMLTVASKKNGRIEARRWDIDHVVSTFDWSLLILDSDQELDTIPRINELRELENGTLVVWQNLDRFRIGELDISRSMSKKMDEVHTHLALVFHRYIAGEDGIKKTAIRMNNVPIIPIDPFLTKRNTQVMATETIILGGSRITVKSFILPHISNLSNDEIESIGGKEGLRKGQGFYVYRNKRLLIWGTWFRMMHQSELSKLARVQVDIPNELDDLWTIDIKKSIAIPPEEVRNSLGSIIEKLADHSKHTWVYRGKKETCDSIVHVWQRYKGKNGGSYYSINREHPLIEVFNEAPVQTRRSVENLLKAIETGLPLSSLYLDLNSDKPVESDASMSTQDLEVVLKGMLDMIPSSDMKESLLDRLSISEPFVNYPDLINDFRKGI